MKKKNIIRIRLILVACSKNIEKTKNLSEFDENTMRLQLPSWITGGKSNFRRVRGETFWRSSWNNVPNFFFNEFFYCGSYYVIVTFLYAPALFFTTWFVHLQ